MRKIAIAAAVSLSLSGVTNVSHALGLGEIEMYSALNQTLDAEIAILSATESEIQGMDVRLASASAFARAGLEQSPVLSSVEFTVDRRPDGKAVVKVTSDTPVLEPFLNFLIEVDAPGSVKLVREYTVLLNPPTFTGNQSSQSDDDLLVSTGAADVFANSTADGTGVEIDLADAMPGSFESDTGLVTATTFDSGSADGEVVFTESTVGSFADAESGTETLFVPDAQVLSEPTGNSTVIDSNGQVISLVQELNTTPQFENTGTAGGESIELTGIGEELSLDNLGAQGDVASASGNAIFTSEFEPGQSELISTEELRGLVGDVTPAAALVEFEESPAESTELFVSDSSSTDADAQGGAGDLIDLSGLVDDSGSVFIEEEPLTSSGEVTNIELSGDTYRVQSQDTLWSIANARKARGVTTHQMVVALVDANPQAFIGGNMNRMISGAVLQIPTASSQSSVDRSNAEATVRSWTRGNTPPPRAAVNIIQPSTVFEDTDTVVDNSSFNTDLNSNLDSVNQRYEEIQTEIATGTVVRDELQGRVDSLTDNMEEMKSLITVREDELNRLQNEVRAAESNAAAIDAQISQLSDASNNVAAVQQGLSDELNQAQNEIAKQADADKNLATAEAEAQSIRLASEEDALRAQLAALDLEKRDLEASSQLDKAALVRESEAEKTRLLEQARAEREKILADLEAEKARITSEAEVEMARVGRGVESEIQQEPLAVETEQLQAQVESELPEATTVAGSDEPSRVKDRLARLQQGATDTAADVQASISDTVDADGAKPDMDALQPDTDAEGAVGDAMDGITDAGKSMTAGGAAAVGGLLGFAPLQKMIGDRKTVLAAGAGLSLLGLLGAWGLRRRKVQAPEVKGLRPRGEGRPVVAAPQGNNTATYDREQAMYGDSQDSHVKPQQRRNSSSAAAAAAAAAAAVTGTAVATSRSDKAADAEKPLAPKSAETDAAPATADATRQAPQATTVPAPQSTAPAQSVDNTVADANASTSGVASTVSSDASAAKPVGDENKNDEKAKVDAELEEKALDDTITEAEVYLRYGLHGQAEDLLKTAIERSPNNEEYHFKLLENYHDQKNADDFNALADTFHGKFPNSGHKARIAEMSAEIASGNTSTASTGSDQGGDAGGNGVGVGGALAAGAAGAAAMATGAAANAKDAVTDGFESLTGKADDMDADLLDQTIDPGSEFSVDELQATGNLGAFVDDEVDFSDQGAMAGDLAADQGGMSLDDVDLASFDDDGTLNLEEVAGNQMSAGDLGSLDLTNPVDNSFDNLSLEDTGLGNVTDNIQQGLDTDLPVGNPMAGGSDEMETMLDLAKAYIDMGDTDNASKALKDIAARGNPLQQTEATELLKKLS